MVARGEACPGTQLGWGGEAAYVADLGHEHRSQNRTDTGDGPDGLVALVVTQASGDEPIEAG